MRDMNHHAGATEARGDVCDDVGQGHGVFDKGTGASDKVFFASCAAETHRLLPFHCP